MVPGVSSRLAVARSVVAAGAVVVLGGCGSTTVKATHATTTGPPSTSTSTSSTVARGSGPVDVYFAASLQKLMHGSVGPAFDAATGYTFTGTPGESGTLANEIKAKTAAADVFISASPAKDQLLEGTAGGNLVTGYATFATSSLELGVNPASKFAGPLTSSPWYQVLTRPGILVGRTDPATDPKGALTVNALDAAATTYKLPALATLATSTAGVFPEATLVGRLQAGQLDVGFFYGVEAASNGIKTVPLTGVPAQHATYTVTVPADAPHPAAAAAFVAYLLSAPVAPALQAAGLAPTTPPQVSGTPPPGVPGAS